MLSKAKTLDLLVSKGLKPVGSVIEDPDKENCYMIFLRKTYDDKGNQFPSNRLVSAVVKQLADHEVGITIAYLDEMAASVDRAVAAMLRSKFPEKIISSLVSLQDGNALVSVELAEQISEDDQANIEQDTKELLSFLGIEASEFIFSASSPLPTVTACIGAVRKHAPISKDELKQKLVDAGFAEPTEAWLNKTLDLWRKKGLLLRRADKRFVLTLEGLNVTGSRRNRTSPDVVRALALGRLD